MYILEGLKMLLLNFNFIMIYIIHKVLVLLKNHMNYLKDSISKCFVKSIIDFYFFTKRIYFFAQHMIGNPRREKENMIKDKRNLFRPKNN